MSTNTNSSVAVSTDNPGTIEYCVFTVGDAEYGIDNNKVQKLCANYRLDALPGAPAFVKGRISVQGMDVPVLDLRYLLKLNGADAEQNGNIIVLEMGNKMVGVLVDNIEGNRPVIGSQVMPLINALPQ
jgi:purine-binding chemotaxis protein CheW